MIFGVHLAITACGNSQTQNTEQATQAEQPQETVSESTYKDIDVDQCVTMIAEGDIVLLDVRTPEETAEGMIEGAVEIDFYGDNFEAEVLKLDREKTYVVYCKSGGRSANAAEMMAKAGFKNVHNLEGGYTAWSEANPDE